MVQFPSKLAFASLLQYSPRGTGKTSVVSRDVRDAVKDDGLVANLRIIDHATERLLECLDDFPFLRDYFGPDITLAPFPRSAPLKDDSVYWPARRICQSLHAQNLGSEVVTALSRISPSQTSSTAPRGQRPNPPDHYVTTEASHPDGAGIPSKVTVVDDFITRGSSFVGVAPHFANIYPGATIRYFALVRTVSTGEIEDILNPVVGTVSYSHALAREP